MKTFILIIFTLSFLNFSQAQTWNIKKVELGLKDQNGKPMYCLTHLESPEHTEEVVLIEDVWDCFWARKAKNHLGSSLYIPQNSFAPLPLELWDYFKTFSIQVQYYYSEFP